MGEREKSALYPAVTIDDCIDFIKVVDSFKSKTVAYKVVAEHFGLSSVTTKSFTQKIGSSKQYGLINTNSSTIQLTDLAKNILYPTSNDMAGIKKECFSLPPLYVSLIQEYDGKAIPDEMLLANILMTKYSISKVAKENAARVFIKNAENLGYIKAGIFSLENADSYESELVEQADGLVEEQGADVSVNNDEIMCSNDYKNNSDDPSDYIIQKYPVESGKIAQIIIPIDSTKDDLLMIRDMLDVVLKRKFKLNE